MHSALLLARQGFSVEIFEREKQLGGMPRYFLPKFRFTRKGIEEKEKKLNELGVKIHLGKEIGEAMPLQGIAEKFDFVILACGEWKARKLGILGESLKGIAQWDSFLRQYNEGRAGKMQGKRAIVIGGGDTAVDCARAAKKLGAEAVIAYRRSREGMPAESREIAAAESEKIKFIFHLSPAKFTGKGKLEAIEFEKTQGQGREMKMTGIKEEVQADIAVIAAGQMLDQKIFGGSKFKSLDGLPENVFIAGDIAGREKRIAAAVRSAAEAVEKIRQITDN